MFFFDLVCTRPNILHKIPPSTNNTPINPYTNIHTKIIRHTHLHKPHHTPLHPHMNLHTKILTHKHLHKIPPNAHHTPPHPHTIINTALFTRQPFTPTIKHLSQHSQKPTQATSHFPQTCSVGNTHLLQTCPVGAPHLVLHGLTGYLSIPKQRYVPPLLQSIIFLHLWRKFNR